jgi:biotin carboxylase
MNDSVSSSVEDRIEKYEKAALAHKVEYPVMIKAKAANRSKYAHIFKVCNNKKGMMEGLEFEGYADSEILI